MGWAPDYITEEHLADYLRGQSSPDDPYLRSAVAAASRMIDHAAGGPGGRVPGRQFGALSAVAERTYLAQWDGRDGLWEVEIDDLMTTTGLVVTVEGSAVASTDYELWPLNRLAEGWPYEYLRLEDSTDAPLGVGPRTVKVTGKWGWLDTTDDSEKTPDTIVGACELLAARLFHRRNAPMGVSGSPQVGGELRLDGRDQDVAAMVRPYWRLSKARAFR